VNLFIVTSISEPLLSGNRFLAIRLHLALTAFHPFDVPLQEPIPIRAIVCQTPDNPLEVTDLGVGEVVVVTVQDVEELLCFIHHTNIVPELLLSCQLLLDGLSVELHQLASVLWHQLVHNRHLLE
jgi:hypothetical protein